MGMFFTITMIGRALHKYGLTSLLSAFHRFLALLVVLELLVKYNALRLRLHQYPSKLPGYYHSVLLPQLFVRIY